MASPEYLDTFAAARLLGVTPATIRTYRARKASTRKPAFPDPAIIIGNRPGWLREDLLAWQETRPGQGRGSRPNRGGDPLHQLERLTAWKEAHGYREDEISAFELGHHILRGMSAPQVIWLADRSRRYIPVAGEMRGTGRATYVVFSAARLHAWLSEAGDPVPELRRRLTRMMPLPKQANDQEQTA